MGLGAVASAFAAACEPGQDPVAVTDFTVVEAMLQIGPTALEFRVFGNDPVTAATPVPTSIVVKSSAGDSVIGVVQPNSSSFRFLVTVGNTFVVPGRSYSLKVQMNNGRVITGTTTVPNSTRPPIDTITFRQTDTLRLSWPRVPGAAGYQVFVNGVDQFGQEPIYSIFTDTSIVLPGNKLTVDEEPIFPRHRAVYLSVSAVDENYLLYYRPTVDPFAGIQPSRLSGGIGVFGSLVNVVRKHIVVQ